MGSRTAADLAECVGSGQIELKDAVRVHLSHNCYPPIPLGYLDPCVRAIGLAGKEEWDTRIETAIGHFDAVSDVVRVFHLEAFVTLAEQEDYTLDELDELNDDEEID